ncbi:SGNH/GDSL hydrolase family protein [Streptomyces sp. 7-21]|jgi:lysophospholipase L1-like esterase|nr:SGNH/GDSL hydrolase family protein [Streptomyces sp. 7-21]
MPPRRPAQPRALRFRLAAVTAALTVLAAAGCTSSSSSGPRDGGAEREASSREPEAGEPSWDTSPSSLAALGDSITTGFDTCRVLADCPEASWATGTDAGVDSLAMRLLGDETAVTERAWNYAEAGATVSGLAAQAREAMAHDPDLVTVLIGANDACAPDVTEMTSVAEFERGFTRALDEIRAADESTQVYVSSVPDLMRLWEEGSGSAMAALIWEAADICPSVLADPGNRGERAVQRREAVRERIEEYNAVLAQVCGADPLCRYDDGAVFSYPFTTDHLSGWDWFHPSEEGQRELARLAYERVTRDGGG